MKTLFLRLRGIGIRNLVAVFPVLACLHEFEEWNILKWHRTYNSNVPSDIVNLDIRTIFLLINVSTIIWTAIALIPKNSRKTAYLFLPLLAIGAVNGFEHLIWLLHFGVYAPGFVFGFLFEIPFIAYICCRIVKEQLVAKWYAGAFGVLSVVGIINLILLGDEIDPLIVYVMKASPMISRFIWE